MVLKVLAEDIMSQSYYQSSYCPITLALKRAGFKNAYHTGMGIRYSDRCVVNESITKLGDMVLGMYEMKHPGMTNGLHQPIPIEDFEMEVDLEEHFWKKVQEQAELAIETLL